MGKFFITPLVKITLCLNLLFSVSGLSQNLVPNPSFEKNKSIPCGFISVLPRNVNDSVNLRPDNLSNYLENWYTPTSGTTDYWFFSDTIRRYQNGKDCTNGASLEGSQPTKARTGSGYIGLYVSSQGTAANYREYAQVKLLSSLKRNTVYHVSFFVQLSNNAENCSDRIGILFSKLPIIRPQIVDKSRFGEPLIYSPQVRSLEYICQPRQWVEVNTCFQASGGEEYLTIGNFFSDENTILQKSANVGNIPLAYYLVDDVTVEEVGGEDYLPQAKFLGPDTTLCPDQQLKISIPFTSGSVYWPGGDTSRTLSVDRSGLYIAVITVGKCIVSDTLRVNIVSKLKLMVDTTICRGEVTRITVTDGVGRIRWEDNSNDSVRIISQEGIYKLKTISHQCSQEDSVHVYVIDCPGEVPNVITPNGDGKNETFFVKNITITPWELTIYNRWGSMIYHTEQYYNEWDAMGSPNGVYYYLLQEKRSKKIVKGWVTVLR